MERGQGEVGPHLLRDPVVRTPVRPARQRPRPELLVHPPEPEAVDAPPRPRYIPALDGVRGVAVALVMAHHFFQHCIPGSTTADRLAFGLADSGWIGVDLFFVLSGFLITGILWDARGRTHGLRNFWARRFLRIFPLYYATLLAVFVVLPALPIPILRGYVDDSAADQGWFWTYLGNFHIAARGEWYQHLIPNVLWSLAIEEQFYLVWPLAVLRWRRTTLLALCAVLLVAALCARLGMVSLGAHPLVSFVSTPTRLDGLLVGAFLALALQQPRADALCKAAWPIAAIAGVVLLGLFLRSGALNWHRDAPTLVLASSSGSLFFGALLLITLQRQGRMVRALRGPFLRTLGKYSYALYLFHGPAALLVAQVLPPNRMRLVLDSGLPRALVFGAASTGLSLLIAWVSWNLFEKHFLGLKHRFQD